MNVRYLERAIGGTVLRGVAMLPAGDPRRLPTAVLHHGFGANRIEAGGLFVQLARSLNAAGFATVAFDRAGHGESDGEFIGTTVSADVRDAVELLDQVAELDFAEAGDLHLVGMSMGSVVASCVAAERATAVRSLALWSPAAVFVDDVRSNSMQGRPIDVVHERGWFDNGGVRLGAAFFEDARTFDVYGLPARFAGPVRVLSGGADEIVPPRYAQRYADVYGPMADITIVPGADHVWSNVPARDLLIAETTAFLLRASSRDPQ